MRLPGLRSVALSTIAAACLAVPSHAEDASEAPSIDDIPHITIVGMAHVEARPDLATITFGVTAERPSAKAAADDVNGRATIVIGAAKAAGVPDIDIATQSVTLEQTYDPIKDEHGQDIGRKPRGFAAQTTVAIKTRDLSKAGTLAETLIAKGADRFDGVEFSVEHPEPIIDKLVGAAVRNARTQSEVAAQAAGVRLGRVLLIERPDQGSRNDPYTLRRQRPAAAMPIEAGTTTLRTSIEVTWAIEPR